MVVQAYHNHWIDAGLHGLQPPKADHIRLKVRILAPKIDQAMLQFSKQTCDLNLIFEGAELAIFEKARRAKFDLQFTQPHSML